MFKVVITEKGGAQRTLDFDKNEVTIGRVQGNDIILPKGNVSKRHSRIVLKDNRFIVVDLKSTNGTYVNGRKITSPLVVKAGDKIYIGDFILTLDENAALAGGASPAMSPSPMAAAPMAGPPPMGPPPLAGPASVSMSPSALGTSPMGPPPMSGAIGMGPPPMGPPPMASVPVGPSSMGPPPLAGSSLGGGPALGGPALGGPALGGPVLGGPALGGPALGGPALGGPALGGPALGGPALGGPALGGPALGGPALNGPALGGGPALGAAPRVTAPPGRAPGPPPPLPARPTPSEPPPPLPPGADRFAIDEDPADETMAPSPRVIARSSEPRAAELPPAISGKPEPVRVPEPARAAEPAPARETAPPREPRPETAKLEPPRLLSSAEPARSVSPASSVAGPPGPALVEVASPDPAALGPLAPLLEEPGVLEIVVEGSRGILLDRGTGLVSAPGRFATPIAAVRAAAQLFAQAGIAFTGAAIQEASLPDGSHVCVVLPPVAIGGPLVEIRRVGRPAIAGETLVAQGLLSNDMLTTLRAAMAVRRNIVVVGPDDAGVATLLSALVAGEAGERLIAIESSPELTLGGSNFVRFTAGASPFGPLIAHASRLRGDRVVIDGVRGAEARDALVSLASRGVATLLGVRAVSHSAVLEHLEALASLAGGKDGVAALIGASVHVVVRMSRGADGTRRVDSIAELGTEGLVELFELGENGFASTGYRPSFMQG
jgi:pilus assembly protein CpaF